MALRAVDKVGKRYGRLVVVKREIRDQQGTFWFCQCDCGKTTVAQSGHLNAGMRVSCGCAQDGSHNKTHGMSRSSEYAAWDNARDRCRNPKNRKYPLYGGRGISMCKEWSESFEAFLADMGKKPTKKHTLERLDGNSGYTPENCVWATPVQQNNNRSINRYIDVNGKSLTIAQASRLTGIPHATILGRLNAGKTDKEALRNG